jgi:hypothetical protein
MHFTGPDPKIDVIESSYSRKPLTDLAYFQDRLLASATLAGDMYPPPVSQSGARFSASLF